MARSSKLRSLKASRRSIAQRYIAAEVLSLNVFCPTGKGGGVDSTCSPKSTQVQITRPKVKNESFEEEVIFKLPQGRMGVAKSKWAPTDWSVTDTFVEEDSRRQGIASKLIETAKANLQGTIGAQCSSDKSVSLFWKHGFRNDSGNIKEALDKRKEYSSVNLIYTPGFTTNAAKRKPLNLLKTDPTRTATLQRAFEEQMKKRFAKFQKALVEYLVSGGLTTNAFCPTGPGGGVDATCSPTSKKKVPTWTKGTPLNKVSLSGGYSLELKSANDKELDYAYVKDGKAVGHLLLKTRKDHGVSLIDHGLDEAHRGKRLGGEAVQKLAEHYGRIHSMDMSHSTDSAKKMWKNIGAKERKTAAGSVLEIDLTTNAFKFETSAAQVENFEQWIISKLTETMEDKDVYSGKDWWKTYVEKAYKQGADKAYDSMTKKGKQDQRTSDRMAGAKNQFFSTFGSDAAKERMKLLAGRTYKGMKGLTEMMKSQLTLALIDGMLQGQSPRTIAKTLVEKVGINKKRALVIARTEIVRSANEGTLETYKALGVKNIGVNVEILVSGKACPQCQKLKNKVFTIDQAQGLLPVHPNCTCAYAPVIDDEPSPQKDRQRKNIEASIKSVARR